MNVLERIRNLRIERGWSEYLLAEKSGLTQSTISAWFRTNTLPTIPSLEKICSAFNISLSQFFMENDNYNIVLTEKQFQLLHQFNKLSSEQQDSLIQFLEKLFISE